MPLKVNETTQEVKNIVIAGTIEELDKHLLDNYLSKGWKVMTAHMTMNDRYNKILEVFYVLVK